MAPFPYLARYKMFVRYRLCYVLDSDIRFWYMGYFLDRASRQNSDLVQLLVIKDNNMLSV